MSVGQAGSVSRGLWAPRIRLKIFAGLVAFQCLSIVMLLASSYDGIPRWVNVTMLACNGLLALLLWMVASAPRPSPALSSAAMAMLLTRFGIGLVSLFLIRGGPDPIIIAMTIAFGAVVFAFVHVTIRTIRREAGLHSSSPAAVVQAGPAE